MVDNIILINSHTNTLANSTMGANSGVGITLSSFLKHLGSVLLGRVLSTTVLEIVLFSPGRCTVCSFSIHGPFWYLQTFPEANSNISYCSSNYMVTPGSVYFFGAPDFILSSCRQIFRSRVLLY